MTAVFDDVLGSAPLFKGFSGAEVLKILERVPYQIKIYPKDYLIAQSGEQVARLILILRGKVAGEMIDFSGKTLKIEDIEAPHLLASAFIFGEKNRFPVNVVSATEVELLVIQRDDFLQLLLSEAGILQNFLRIISSRSQFLSQKLRFLSFKTLKQKIAHYLLQETKGKATQLTLTKSQRELADLFGVARPSLARAMGEMEKDGLLAVNRREVHILNRDGLAGLMHEQGEGK